MEKTLGRKNIFLVLVLSLVVLLAGCSAASGGEEQSTPQEEKKTTEQIVQEAFEKWYGLDSYDMDLSMNMKMVADGQPMDMDMKGQGTVFQNPMKMKMVIETSIPGMDMDQKMEMTQYMVEEDQKITLYQHFQGQWFKMVMDDPVMTQMMDPMDNLELFMDNLVKSEIVGEEKIGDRDTMKIELIASEKVFDELLSGLTDESLGMSEDMLNTEVLSKIGDITYTIWIDKNSLDIVKSYMDLTDNMKNLGAAISDQDATDEQIELFKNMEISMQYTVYNQNESADFSLPEEAKNAMELPAGI